MRAGDEYRQLGADEFELAQGSSSEMQLFAMAQFGESLAGVVYLWGLDGGEQPCLPLLNLLRNLARNERLPRVWVATRGALDGLDGWDRAQLWGMAQAARLEHPGLGLTCVDLDGSGDAEGLYSEITGGSEERHVAYRRGARLAGRLTRAGRERRRWSGRRARSRSTRGRGAIWMGCGCGGWSVGRRARARSRFEVRAAGLNFLDVLDALGALPFERGWLGGECSGVVTAVGAGVTEFSAGDEVVALAEGAFGRTRSPMRG